MNYKYEFQYIEPGRNRPNDYVIHEDEFDSHSGKYIPLPNVGDSVFFETDPERKPYKVVTKHFYYGANWCIVNIVVTDMDEEEMSARLKM